MISLHRDAESKLLMKKFAYEIHQLLEVSNVFYRIMNDPSEKIKNPQTHEHPLNIIIIKYPNTVIQVAQTIFDENIYELQLLHNNKMSAANLIQKTENPEQTKEVINYLTELSKITPDKVHENEELCEFIKKIPSQMNNLVLGHVESNLRRLAGFNNPNRSELIENLVNLNNLREKAEEKFVDMM